MAESMSGETKAVGLELSGEAIIRRVTGLCGSLSEPSSSSYFCRHFHSRNGLGDDSFFIWPERSIAYTVDPSFNESSAANVAEAVADYNEIFEGCFEWVERSDEVIIAKRKRAAPPLTNLHKFIIRYDDYSTANW